MSTWCWVISRHITMRNFLETGLSKAEILWFIAFQIGRHRHLLGGNKHFNGSHDHNHALFGVIFYFLVRLDIATLCTKFDSSSLSRSLDMGWVESVIINWCEFLFSVLTVFHTFSLPYFPLLHFPLPHFQRPPLPQPIKAGTRFSDPKGMQDWVDLVGLVTYQGSIPARRRSPIPVLTGINVEQLRSRDERRYHSAKPPSDTMHHLEMDKATGIPDQASTRCTDWFIVYCCIVYTWNHLQI